MPFRLAVICNHVTALLDIATSPEEGIVFDFLQLQAFNQIQICFCKSSRDIHHSSIFGKCKFGAASIPQFFPYIHSSHFLISSFKLTQKAYLYLYYTIFSVLCQVAYIMARNTNEPTGTLLLRKGYPRLAHVRARKQGQA